MGQDSISGVGRGQYAGNPDVEQHRRDIREVLALVQLPGRNGFYVIRDSMTLTLSSTWNSRVVNGRMKVYQKWA